MDITEVTKAVRIECKKILAKHGFKARDIQVKCVREPGTIHTNLKGDAWRQDIIDEINGMLGPIKDANPDLWVIGAGGEPPFTGKKRFKRRSSGRKGPVTATASKRPPWRDLWETIPTTKEVLEAIDFLAR